MEKRLGASPTSHPNSPISEGVFAASGGQRPPERDGSGEAKEESSKGRRKEVQRKMGLYESIAFALFAIVTVGSASGVVLLRDVWHSALLLGVSLLSVAVFYVMNQAAFVATMQILVYVGGVLILITFAVMLTREDESVIEVTP
jgi:NADH-quinone oxidoreductase subunit J